MSASAHEFRDVEKRKNGENNIDRPLPPLPRENSLTIVDESASDEIDEDDSDVYENDSNSSNDAPLKDNGENKVNSTNGFNDESSFDADATLPLSPSEKITMNGTGERYVCIGDGDVVCGKEIDLFIFLV